MALALSLSRALSAALAPSVPKCRSPWSSLSPRSLGDSGKSTAGRRDVSNVLSQSEHAARLGGTSLAKLSSSLAKQPQPRGVRRSSGWFTFPPPFERRGGERGEINKKKKKKPHHILTCCVHVCVCQKKCTSAEVGSYTITRGGGRYSHESLCSETRREISGPTWSSD